ncbi:MAG: DNA cytosine methyltransferase [Jatrophihabitantaceae bacterium]
MSRPTAIDLFAGAGGATQGLKDAGLSVVGAIEKDSDAATSYRRNHPFTHLWEQDIVKLPASVIRRTLKLEKGELTLLKACPPCQGFSTLAEGRVPADDSRNDLVGHTVRFVREFRPRFVMLENVPGLARDRRATALTNALQNLGYATRAYNVDARDFGVPQRRKRIILVSIRGLRNNKYLPISLVPIGIPGTTVRQALGELQQVAPAEDSLNVHRTPTRLVDLRIRAIPINGNRRDLPSELQLACHIKIDATSRSAAASYGRLKLDDVAPTMTTRCTTPACGSFIHPTEPRGITLREASWLQTFPISYIFEGAYGSIERQIGNAVPPRMVQLIVRGILNAGQSANG